MKKLLIILMVLSFIFISIYTGQKIKVHSVSSPGSTNGYASIITNDCYLLTEPNAKDKLFLLEQSYFVKIIENFDEMYYKVQYLEFQGFVEKNKISFVEEIPEIPFLCGITFDIYDLANVCLRKTPYSIDDDRNIICTISVSTKDLMYYGKCTGEEVINGLGNIWYYCAYEDKLGNIYKGYIYSPLTRNLSSIPCSAENLTKVNISNYIPIESLLYLNLSIKNILIIITIIPTIISVLLFTIPSRNREKTK